MTTLESFPEGKPAAEGDHRTVSGNRSLGLGFGDVEIRYREFSLIKVGKAQPLEPMAFRVLLTLPRTPEKLITKEERQCSMGDAADPRTTRSRGSEMPFQRGSNITCCPVAQMKMRVDSHPGRQAV